MGLSVCLCVHMYVCVCMKTFTNVIFPFLLQSLSEDEENELLLLAIEEYEKQGSYASLIVI